MRQNYNLDATKTDIGEKKNMATIIRLSYIDRIETYLGKETIIVLVGQRRVVKTA